MSYSLEGRMLEACSCDAICPCWVGQDPDGGRCEGTIAWHFDKGQVDGVDVSGLTIAVAADIPGNALKGNWRAVVFVDSKANPQQEKAILDVFTGKQGGPVADLVQLIGTVVKVEKAPIKFSIEKGHGQMQIGSGISIDMEGLTGATGEPTVLTDAAFSVIRNAPAYIGKSKDYKIDVGALGLNKNFAGHSAIQGHFLFAS
jgi:hypothetical protein